MWIGPCIAYCYRKRFNICCREEDFLQAKGVLGPIFLYVDGKAYMLTKLPISPRMLACRNFGSACVLTIPRFRANTKRYRVLYEHLSDMWISTLEIVAAPLHSVKPGSHMPPMYLRSSRRYRLGYFSNE